MFGCCKGGIFLVFLLCFCLIRWDWWIRLFLWILILIKVLKLMMFWIVFCNFCLIFKLLIFKILCFKIGVLKLLCKLWFGFKRFFIMFFNVFWFILIFFVVVIKLRFCNFFLVRLFNFLIVSWLSNFLIVL